MHITKQGKTFIMVLTLVFTTITTHASESDSTAELKQDVELRQTAFSTINDQQGEIADMLDNDDLDWQELENISTALTTNSASLKYLFKPGSQLDSKAKDNVWKHNQKFTAALATMDNHFLMMDNAIQQQDSSKAKAALKKANKTCNSCHRQYRSRW